MKSISYTIINPGGNITALITSSLPKAERIAVANKLLGTSLFKQLGVEQIGYIQKGRGKIISSLQMANGELCINGTRCLAALAARQTSSNVFSIKTSGLKGFVLVKSKKIRDNNFLITTQFKLENLVRKSKIEEFLINSKPIRGQLVYLSGVAHFLTEWSSLSTSIKKLMSNKNAGKSSREVKEFTTLFNEFYLNKKSLEKELAVGFIAYERISSTKYKIWPLIKVNKQETIYYETACGSGTLALAYMQNNLCRSKSFDIKQPSEAIIEVTVKKETIVVEGKVQIVCEGTIQF